MTKEKTKHEKNVELSNMKLEQTTLVNDIVIGASELGHKRIVLTTMIINTIKSNVVDLSYKDKTTNVEYLQGLREHLKQLIV